MRNAFYVDPTSYSGYFKKGDKDARAIYRKTTQGKNITTTNPAWFGDCAGTLSNKEAAPKSGSGYHFPDLPASFTSHSGEANLSTISLWLLRANRKG